MLCVGFLAFLLYHITEAVGTVVDCFSCIFVSMEVIKDIVINLAANAVWALGGFALAYFHILKKSSALLKKKPYYYAKA